jgi:hypothetical protein
VIGKGGRRIPEADALTHIAGLTLCNEGTLRDWVRHAKFNVTQGKNWDGSGAMGPWLVPFPTPPRSSTYICRPASTARPARTTAPGACSSPSPGRSPISRPSPRWCPATSSSPERQPAPAPVRSAVWLVPGDTIEIEAEGIGTLRNGVVGRMTPEQIEEAASPCSRRKGRARNRLLSLATRHDAGRRLCGAGSPGRKQACFRSQ